ncbi:MAG: ribonuclease HII [Lachnospiraceae bacterium]|nr:ribonuclease HII [Lachnospiraceae bacterium]MDD3659180.1 ribonuclease HII [Lachnospiraceae bacterium]
MEESIKIIKDQFQAAGDSMLPELIHKYKSDVRSGVADLVKKAEKKIDALEKEWHRTKEMSRYEESYPSHFLICGIDEVGRGPLAGPVVAGAVILNKEDTILYLNDSKKLSASKREELYEEIISRSISYGLGYVSPEEIDRVNILQATYCAMRQAIQNLSVRPDILLNDAVTIPEISISQLPIIKGDAKSVSIAAASIIAKVTRDRMMEEYDKIFPEYAFASNKGYGSAAHIEALKKYGPSPIHRKTFIGNFI